MNSSTHVSQEIRHSLYRYLSLYDRRNHKEGKVQLVTEQVEDCIPRE